MTTHDVLAPQRPLARPEMAVGLVDLPVLAERIADALRANGFPKVGAVQRQVLGLAEEVGEFVGAYRRWSGQARRSGTAQDMHAELADVVITAYVTAHELDMDLNAAIAEKAAVVFARGWREPRQTRFTCSVPAECPCGDDATAHETYQRHGGHGVTERADCPYCPTPVETAAWTRGGDLS